jgi:hypothetical protein
MPEETYAEYKEESTHPVAVRPRRRAFPAGLGTMPHPGRKYVRRRRPLAQATAMDYEYYKATIATADDIGTDIRGEHRQSRAEAQTARRDLLIAIKASPAEYLKLVCEFGSLFMVFCLAIRFAFNIELVNTAFGLFMLFAFTLYWLMAIVKQWSDRKANQNRKA